MTQQQELARSLDLTRKSSDAQRVLLNRLAYATVREIERKIKQQKQGANNALLVPANGT